jgi:hypothetical protein
MKANELRIGNLVMHYNDLCTVIGYYDDIFIAQSFDKIDFKSNVFNLQPIPLTKEWLLKFGLIEYIDFGVKMGTYDKMPLCGFTYSIHTKKVMIMHKGNSISHWLNINIDYVHQLQNLYFALTGEELTFKSEE